MWQQYKNQHMQLSGGRRRARTSHSSREKDRNQNATSSATNTCEAIDNAASSPLAFHFTSTPPTPPNTLLHTCSTEVMRSRPMPVSTCFAGSERREPSGSRLN